MKHQTMYHHNFKVFKAQTLDLRLTLRTFMQSIEAIMQADCEHIAAARLGLRRGSHQERDRR